MRFLFVLLSVLVFQICGYAQTKLDKTLKKFNKESVPYIFPENLSIEENVALLDARKKEEYEVSHLKNAIWVGHKEFDEQKVLEQFPDKKKNIVVYCSIGVRSENIGEKLLALGYENVKNLYGGIFEWKNNDGKLYNSKETETDTIHAFNKHWGKLLLKGEKIYDSNDQ